uniref:Uncharacterized protein n=1 Tax=Setaria viridis TaxID=4556 RepID=A0A4U6WBG4_SETVI|nr:hypothetical protein SEVIR_1G222701v2 [Setaria viridis]
MRQLEITGRAACAPWPISSSQPVPISASGPGAVQAGILVLRPGPDIRDQVAILGREGLGLLIGEDRRCRHLGRCRHDDGDMVRHQPGQGAEDGVREEGAPGGVDKGPIQTHQSGHLAAIAPGELPVGEGQFLKLCGVHGGIEALSRRRIEVVVVAVGGVAREFEVAENQPWDRGEVPAMRVISPRKAGRR